MQGKEELNKWSAADYARNILMLLLKVPIWAVQVLLFWLPLKKNRIIIYSLKQHGYSCNLKYLTEYLRENHPTDFEILWIVRSHEDARMLARQEIPVAMLHSWEHVCYRMCAGIVVTNDEFYPVFLKRFGQRYINTWHGGINYKKIGYAGLAFTNPLQKLIYRMNNPCPDLFVSGSRAFTETASEAFGFPKEVFFECGLPRNDVLCDEPNPERVAQLKEHFGIPRENKVLLYAPTFRKGNHAPGGISDYNRLCLCLSRKFGGAWSVLIRHHYFIHDTGLQNSGVIDVSQHEDMQELLLCSDCLISDYSSCMWDYILTEKPCFVYAQDLYSYDRTDRSFFIPPESWPYAISGDMEELCKNIEQFDPDSYKLAVRAHKKDMGSFDSGNACRKLAHCLINNMNT